MKNEIGTKSKA